MVTGCEGRGQEIQSDLGAFWFGAFQGPVVLFSTVGGETRFCFVFSRDRALGIGRDEFRRDPWEYSIEIKRRPT